MRLSTATALVLAAATAAAQAETAPARSELVPTRILVADSGHELSGAAFSGKRLLAVADAAEDHYIYELTPRKRRFALKKLVDLSKLAGFADYLASLQAETRVAAKDQRLDLEGIATCGDTLYLVNERVRHVLVVDPVKKTLARLPVDLASYADLFAGEANAGFEGVAADCAKGLLYVAKERAPRQILTVDLQTAKLVATHDVTPSDRANQKVLDVFDGEGLIDVGPDFADLTFDGGYLYALERNSYEVTKIDPATFAVLARVSYLKTERPLYETGEPFGIAEMLVLTPGEIWVGTDNNGKPLSGSARDALGVKGKSPAVMVFPRPAGF